MRSSFFAAFFCLALAASAASPDFRAPPLGAAGLATNNIMTWGGYTLGGGRNVYAGHIWLDRDTPTHGLTVCSWVAIHDCDLPAYAPGGEAYGYSRGSEVLPSLYYSPNIERSTPDLLGGAWGWGGSAMTVSGSRSVDYGFPAAGTAPSSFRYLRMSITAKRSSSEGYVQLSEIKLVSPGGASFSWPSGASVSATMNGSNASFGNANEMPEKLIDNSVSTKMCAANATRLPCVVTIDLGAGNAADLSIYSKWQWYTANDYNARDPKSFSFSVSNDGSSWFVLNAATNATVTTTRNALAYTGNVTLPPPPFWETVAWNGGSAGTNAFPRGCYTVAWTNFSSTMTLTAGGEDMTLEAPAGVRNVEPAEADGFILTGSGTGNVGISRMKIHPFYSTGRGIPDGTDSVAMTTFNRSLVGTNWCFVAHRILLDSATHTNDLTIMQRNGRLYRKGMACELPPDGTRELKASGWYQLLYSCIGEMRLTYVYEWDRRVFDKWLSDDDLSAIFEDGCRIRDAFGYPDCVVTNAIYQEDP